MQTELTSVNKSENWDKVFCFWEKVIVEEIK
jgi:hypothetical protein